MRKYISDLRTLAKLQKETISFFMSLRPSVCLSARPQETTQRPLGGFSRKLVCTFLKSVEIFQI